MSRFGLRRLLRPGRKWAFGLLVAFLFLYPFPYFEAMRSANELPRIYLTQAMVDEGRFAIDTGVGAHGATADVSPSGGHYYSNKAPGSSFLAIPAYLVLKAAAAARGTEPSLAQVTWAFRLTTGIVPTLLFLLFLSRFLRRYVTDDRALKTAVAAYAVGTMAYVYSVLFIAHQLSAVCIGGAWMLAVCAAEDRWRARWFLLVGALAGAAPLCDYQAAFAGVPVAVYLMWTLLRKDWRAGAFKIGLAMLGAIPPIALLLVYHARAFGSPLRTGYDASKTFAHYHQRGFLGMDQLRLDAFVGSTIAPDNGLFFLCPMLLLAIPGFVLLYKRRHRATFAVTLSVVVIYLLFISSLSFWRGGWQVGPRYITAMLPFVMVPIAVAIDAVWGALRSERGGVGAEIVRAVAVALIAASIFIYTAAVALFPHFPETFDNPLHGLVLRLIAEGYAAPNAGNLLGLHGTASLVPYGLAVAALLVFIVAAPTRRALRSGVLGLLMAAALVAGYRAAADDGGEDAERSYRRITTWMP